MQIHNLKRQHKNKKDRLVGRGGKHAKTSGRGGKGQTARSGNKRRPELRDIIKRLPKNRGYKFKSIQNMYVLTKDKTMPTNASKGPARNATHSVAGGEKFSEIRKRLGIKGKKLVLN